MAATTEHGGADMAIVAIETTLVDPGEASAYMCTRCGETEDSRRALDGHNCDREYSVGGYEDRLDDLNERYA